MKRALFLLLLGILLISGLLAAVSCGTSSQTTATTPGTGLQTSPPPGGTTGLDYKPAAVEIKVFAFLPATITVAIGTTITWTNNDSTLHTVTSLTDAFDSGTLANGGTFSFTFTTAGTYQYRCSIHTEMQGTVIVQ